MPEPFTYKDYTIRAMVATDYPAMELLYEKVYRKQTKKGFYATKYSHYDKTLPVVIGFVAATTDGELVASTALVPVKLCRQNNIMVGAQWADAMVHPSHQNKGLALILCNTCMQQAKQTGIDIVFCLPVEATYKLVTEKLQHQFISTMLCYTVRIHTLPLASIANRLRYKNGYGSLIVSLFSKHSISPQSFPRIFSQKYVTLFRDATFLSYKESLGSFYIKSGSSMIWLTFKKGTLFIGDMFSSTEKDFIKTMAILKRICFYAGIPSIIFQTTRGSKTAAYCSKHYKAVASYKVCALSFTTTLDVEQLQLTYGDGDNF